MGRHTLVRGLTFALCALGLWLAAAAPAATAAKPFRPRIGGAMGVLPVYGTRVPQAAIPIPAVYHGGTVMHGAHIHAIFWAPSGYRFSPAPADGKPDYPGLLTQFLDDAATASGTSDNSFSLLNQYGDRTGPGAYRLTFDPAQDVVQDGDAYPLGGRSCVSPSGAEACVTDLDIQHELEHLLSTRYPAGRGLHDVWLVFLPPAVDTCTSEGECASNAYAGYHSLENLSGSPVIYSVIPSPLLEVIPSPGSDPQGNPEAESAIDTVAHEVVEAMTDPEGTGWMDPNGLEVADKCEDGPQIGTPLGYAADGAPYNQLINGHPYLLQAMWSDVEHGCRQRSGAPAAPVSLPRVSLTQFSPVVSGNVGVPAGTPVEVLLARGGEDVVDVSTRVRAGGSWRVLLRLSSGAPVGVGDDREEMLVVVGTHNPILQLIQTGDGGNPFTAAGWTGWFDLDHGAAVRNNSVVVGPCTQTGVLTLRVDGRPVGSPVDSCSTSNDTATVQTPRLTRATPLTFTSNDNRSSSEELPLGGLVSLTVALGEPHAVPAVANNQLPYTPTGNPSCVADLHAQNVRCSGLVARARYALARRRGHATLGARADGHGVAVFGRLRGGIRGGDVVTLRGAGDRTLVTLHVAHLRVDVQGRSTVVASGRCQPGDFYGLPLSRPPLGAAIGLPGVAATGRICPLSGHARGLPSGLIEQQDDRGSGSTRTEVPVIQGTAPAQDATLYGPFVALAQASLPGPHGTTFGVHDRVAVTIVPAGGHRPVFHAANVNTARGTAVRRLPRGSYQATWVLSDAAGDTRSLRTVFVEA